MATEESLHALIQEALQAAPQLFAEHELAYLGATGRIDAALRDKLAFWLHQKVGEQYRVAREWRRYDFPGRNDVMLLNATNVPQVVVQIRSNLQPTDIALYMLEMQSDLIRLRDVAAPETLMYHVVLLGAPLPSLSYTPQAPGSPDAANPFGSFTPMAGYFENWTRAWQQLRTDWEQVYWQTLARWQDYAFITLGMDSSKLATERLDAGTYYGTRLQYILFINGPFTVADNIFQISGWRKP